jgi:hypothetical protein
MSMHLTLPRTKDQTRDPGRKRVSLLLACEDRPVVPADIHEFFEASAGVAGALIGLLFVAISVAGDRLNRSEAPAQLHRIRAAAALAAFTNALTVSLWSLIPTEQIGVPAVVVASGGLLFVAASMLSLIRLHAVRATARDATFLVLFLVTFGLQFAAGVDLDVKTNDPSMVENLAVLGPDRRPLDRLPAGAHRPGPRRGCRQGDGGREDRGTSGLVV